MKFSFNRKITSYSKVQQVVASIIRSEKLFVKRQRIKGLQYLNIGCGPNPMKDHVNLDYAWTPDIDICWDITRKPYPLADGSLQGIYTEHCLEHISYADCFRNLQEFKRMLRPGGVVRIVVPDGELYFDLYRRRRQGETVTLPYEEGYDTAMHRINGIFRNHGHQFIYDFETFSHLLKKAGFTQIERKSFGTGRDPQLLVDTADRAFESLYVEAVKP